MAILEVTALLVVGALLTLGAIYGPGLLTRRRALKGAIRVVEDIASGQTQRRADATATAEAGRLARAINRLALMLQELRTQSEQYRDNLFALLDHTEELVIATDEEDAVQMVSPAAARMLDRPASALIGRPITDVFTQRDILDLYRSAYSSPKPVSMHLRLTVARKEIQCHATATTMYAGPRYRGTLLLMRDLTEIAQAVQMKTDFVANASHELRTPLASIRAAVETVNDAWEDLHNADAEVREPSEKMIRRCIDIIGGQVLRLQMMVQDLLDLSRTEDPRAVVRNDRLDLMQVCDTVTGMYAGLAAEKQVALRVELGEDARIMRGDERLLLLVLKNLVDNALKFTPVNGTVTLESAVAGGHGGGRTLTLAVRDTGCGIPKEDQQRVFERFYTVNRSRGGADRGTGLGLAIVKHAVAAMAGTVTLESEVNRGTTVRCTFPLPAQEGVVEAVGAR